MAVTLTGIETEVYSGKVHLQFQAGDVYGTSGMIFYANRPTEVINDPVITGDVFGRHEADGSDHTAEDNAMVGVEVPLFEVIKSRTSIPYSKINVRPDLGMVGRFGTKNGRNLATGKTIRLNNALAKVADTAGNTIDVDENATDGTAPRKCREAIEELAGLMDNLGVPGDMRRGVLSPRFFYKLGSEQGVIRRDYGGKANAQTLGSSSLEYANFTMVKSPLGFGVDYTATAQAGLALPSPLMFDMTDVLGVFWHPEAWALREQEFSSAVDNIPEKQIVQLLSRYHMGFKEIQADGIWALVQQ